MLHHVRRGFSKLVPPSSHRAKRPPVTIEALSFLAESLDSASPFDCAVGAVAMVAFWSCCRLGELIVPSPGLFDPLKHVSRSVLPLSIFTLQNNTRAASFSIPWTKTTKERSADISVTARPHCTCPLSALERHFSINASLPANAPLFAYVSSTGGAWAPLARPEFIQRCNAIWVAHGFPNLPGHAFRIGGATELLLQGVHPDVVATQGRWTSRSFLEYWRRVETILPLFISSSIDTQRLLSLDTVMDSFASHHRLSRAAPSS
jgi:hypothetical protein